MFDAEGFDLEHLPLHDPNAFVAGQFGRERESSVVEYYFTM